MSHVEQVEKSFKNKLSSFCLPSILYPLPLIQFILDITQLNTLLIVPFGITALSKYMFNRRLYF